LRADRWSR